MYNTIVACYFLTHSVFWGLLFTAFVKEVVLSFFHFVSRSTYSRSRGSISVKFFFWGGEVGVRTRKSRLDFGDDLD